MFDPDFDPLEQLVETKQIALDNKRVINQLIKAHNGHDQLWVELTQQHRNLVALIREHREHIAKLELEISLLKQQIQPKNTDS